MSAEYQELIKFSEQLKQLNEDLRGQFIEECAKEIAARLLNKVIKRTPVGVYKDKKGKTKKQGGTLRRGWTDGKSATEFCQQLNVSKRGNSYVIDIINPVEYASYVEFGHRTRNHSGWVKGHFMLTISENEIRSDMPNILERKLRKKLNEVIP